MLHEGLFSTHPQRSNRIRRLPSYGHIFHSFSSTQSHTHFHITCPNPHSLLSTSMHPRCGTSPARSSFNILHLPTLVLFLLIFINIASAASFRGYPAPENLPNHLSANLKARKETCKALGNCPTPPGKKVLDNLPWHGVPRTANRPGWPRKRSGRASGS